MIYDTQFDLEEKINIPTTHTSTLEIVRGWRVPASPASDNLRLLRLLCRRLRGTFAEERGIGAPGAACARPAADSTKFPKGKILLDTYQNCLAPQRVTPNFG